MQTKNNDQAFEEYWKKHKESLLLVAPKTLQEERKNSSKLNTVGDWVLFIACIALMIGVQDSNLIKNELLNFVVSVVVGVAAFGVATLIKPYVTGKRNVVDIDADAKEYFRHVYEENGPEFLDRIRG